jgi:hypothetical protein
MLSRADTVMANLYFGEEARIRSWVNSELIHQSTTKQKPSGTWTTVIQAAA